MNIQKFDRMSGTYRQGTLCNTTAAKIAEVLGFKPNLDDDYEKVENSWGFTVDGEHCAIWDYKGSHHWGQFSYFGPRDLMVKLFGEQHVSLEGSNR